MIDPRTIAALRDETMKIAVQIAPLRAASPGSLRSLSPTSVKPASPVTSIKTSPGIPVAQVKPGPQVQRTQSWSQPSGTTATGNPGVTAGAKGLPSPPVRS